MKRILISRNSAHLDKLNNISNEVLTLGRYIHNSNKNKENLKESNYNINDVNSKSINPNIKEKITNIFSELSFREKPLSKSINNYNSKLVETKMRLFHLNKNKIENEKKKISLNNKKKEIMNLLNNFNNKLSKNKKMTLKKNKNKNVLKSRNIKLNFPELKFSERMKSEISKILYKTKEDNLTDEVKEIKNNENKKIKSYREKHTRIQTEISERNSSLSNRNYTNEIINQLKIKYRLNYNLFNKNT